MSQPDTISAADVFHPDGMAALAALAGVRDDHPAWHDDALCAQTDPEAFFPEKGGSTREAKEICNRCPVRTECLADALSSDTRFGVWGGLSERERRVLGPALRAERGTEQAALPVREPREEPPAERRESAPPRGRRGGPGVAATLPTEPRPHRAAPERPRSTFPDRAHTTAPDHPLDRAPQPPATRGTGRRHQTRPAAPAARSRPRRPAPTHRVDTGATGITSSPVPAGGGPSVNDTEAPAGAAAAAPDGQTVPAPRADTPITRVTSSAPVGEDPTAGQPGPLREAVRVVLAGQDGQPGAADVDLAAVLALTSALAGGSPVDGSSSEGAGPWERRVATVAAVLSGTLTRGQTARRLGERSQDVSHWVRRHLEGMPLVEPDPPNRPRAAGER